MIKVRPNNEQAPISQYSCSLYKTKLQSNPKMSAARRTPIGASPKKAAIFVPTFDIFSSFLLHLESEGPFYCSWSKKSLYLKELCCIFKNFRLQKYILLISKKLKTEMAIEAARDIHRDARSSSDFFENSNLATKQTISFIKKQKEQMHSWVEVTTKLLLKHGFPISGIITTKNLSNFSSRLFITFIAI